MDPLSLLNQHAPDFELPDIAGNKHHLADWVGKTLILNFWSAECPYSEKADLEIAQYLPSLGEDVAWVSIASNANEPFEMIQQVATERDLPLVLHDAQQRVARLYHAQVTPHAFVLDTQGIVRYQGAVNDRTFRKRVPEQFYLRQAVDALLAGKSPDPGETPAYGCAVVYYQA